MKRNDRNPVEFLSDSLNIFVHEYIIRVCIISDKILKLSSKRNCWLKKKNPRKQTVTKTRTRKREGGGDRGDEKGRGSFFCSLKNLFKQIVISKGGTGGTDERERETVEILSLFGDKHLPAVSQESSPGDDRKTKTIEAANEATSLLDGHVGTTTTTTTTKTTNADPWPGLKILQITGYL